MTELLLSALFGPLAVLAGMLLVYQNAAGLWRTRRARNKTACEWEVALDADARWVADAKAELWRAIEHLADDRDEMPPELREVADDILQLADLTERAAARRMVERGLVPQRPLFQQSAASGQQQQSAASSRAAIGSQAAAGDRATGAPQKERPSQKRLRLVHSEPGLGQERRRSGGPDVDWVDGRPVPQVR